MKTENWGMHNLHEKDRNAKDDYDNLSFFFQKYAYLETLQILWSDRVIKPLRINLVDSECVIIVLFNRCLYVQINYFEDDLR